MPQGKCDPCKVAFRWTGKPLLRDSHCPTCGRPLTCTTYRLKRCRWMETAPQLFRVARL